MHLARLHRRVIEASGQKLADRPDVIRQALRHRWRRAQRFMDAAEIEVCDIKSHCREMIIDAFAKTVGQAREASARHAKR